jgi:hypothetical protein
VIELGFDPALGGRTGLVACHLGDKLTILDARSDVGLQRVEEELEAIEDFVVKYKPSTVTVEIDSQQKGFANDERLRMMGLRYGFAIRSHTTRGKKRDETFGVAAMDKHFRKGTIRIPWGDQRSIDKMTPLVTQLRAWRPDIATKHLTQDLVMALWFVVLHWEQMLGKHENPPPAWRPSWLGDTPYTPGTLTVAR